MSSYRPTSHLFAVTQLAFSRHLLKYPWQLALALLGMAVGIAVIVAIQLVRISSFEAFQHATQVDTGGFSHQLVRQDRRAIPLSIFVELNNNFPNLIISPVIGFQAQIRIDEEHATKTIYVLGIDPIARSNLNRHENSAARFDIQDFIRDPKFAAINQASSEALQLKLGDTLELLIDDNIKPLTIAAIVPNQDVPGGLTSDTLLVDIATSQELAQRFDRLTRIDIDGDQVAIKEVSSWLPADYWLVSNAEEKESLKGMTQAFYNNLTALSLMALLMGMFLIYNTESFIVLQRIQMIARLRAIGVEKRQILSATLFESAILGLIGSLVGISIGHLLARKLLAKVSITLNDLYFKNTSDDIVLSPTLIITCVLLGISTALIAGAVPAYLAANKPMSQAMQNAGRIHRISKLPIFLFSTLGMMGFASAGLTLYFSADVNAGFFAIACALVGFACLCPAALYIFSSSNAVATHRQHKNFLFERLGLRTLALGLNRSSTATAALMIATAASIGIGVMVTSFRSSVEAWLTDSLQADFYISKSFSLDATNNTTISPADKKILTGIAGVEMLSSVTRAQVVMHTTSSDVSMGQQKIMLSAFELNPRAKRSFQFISKQPDIWQKWETENVLIITEPFAYHNKFTVGDILTLTTKRGPVDFLIAGVYKDYASERGSVSISRPVFDQHWNRKGYNGIGMYTTGGISSEELRTKIQQHPTLREMSLLSSDKLREQSLAVFDRTFLITNLLKVITVAVAFIGIVGALLAQQLERAHEYGVFRALGFNKLEMFRLIVSQTLYIGVIATLIAIPAGLMVAWILTDVINPRSFGWTMGLLIPVETIATASLTAIVAALLAGLIPAWKISRVDPARSLHFE